MEDDAPLSNDELKGTEEEDDDNEITGMNVNNRIGVTPENQDDTFQPEIVDATGSESESDDNEKYRTR